MEATQDLADRVPRRSIAYRTVKPDPTVLCQLCNLPAGDAGFTDIEFNPERSINCQARSCALLVTLLKNDWIDYAVSKCECPRRASRAGRTREGDRYSGPALRRFGQT